jgi:hypothetical protein
MKYRRASELVSGIWKVSNSAKGFRNSYFSLVSKPVTVVVQRASILRTQWAITLFVFSAQDSVMRLILSSAGVKGRLSIFVLLSHENLTEINS